MKKPISIQLSSILTLFLSFFISCGGEKIVIASKPPTENMILAEMQRILIEEFTDYGVIVKDPITGGTSNIHPAIIRGDIDLYTEYTGTGYHFVLHYDEQTDDDTMFNRINEDYSEKFSLTWLGRYGFNNTFGLAMKRERARALGIISYSDLARVSRSSQLHFGAEPDFFERDDGFKALRELYDFNFSESREIVVGLKYLSLENGEVDVINVFTTDGSLEQHDLIVLEDDRGYFPFYSAATVIRQQRLKEFPDLRSALEKMTDLIDNDSMTNMNYRVEVKHEDPARVAWDFLISRGVLANPAA